MRRTAKHFFGLVLVLAMFLSFTTPSAQAGRIGGPVTTAATVPGGMSVYYDIPFAEGLPAIVAIVGDGSWLMDVIIYDSNGNSMVGAGYWDRKIATMNVTRTGFFRVEVRNLGIAENTFTLTTN